MLVLCIRHCLLRTDEIYHRLIVGYPLCLVTNRQVGYPAQISDTEISGPGYSSLLFPSL